MSQNNDPVIILLRAIGHVSTDADAVSFLDAQLSRFFVKARTLDLDDAEAFAYHSFVR